MTNSEPFDLTAALIDYEDGAMNHEEVIELFQYLVDTGIVWKLQGHYTRTAKDLLRFGEIHPAHHNHTQAPESGL